MNIDLDDTSRCPLGHRCESCGVERDDLAVCTVALARLGVACLTLCPRCAGSDVIPPVSVGTAVRLSDAAHRLHLGITVDDMDEALGGGGSVNPREDRAAQVLRRAKGVAVPGRPI